jgi:hypothetical protein
MKGEHHAQRAALSIGARVPLAGRTDSPEWRLPLHGPRVYFTPTRRMDFERRIATTMASTIKQRGGPHCRNMGDYTPAAATAWRRQTLSTERRRGFSIICCITSKAKLVTLHYQHFPAKGFVCESCGSIGPVVFIRRSTDMI